MLIETVKHKNIPGDNGYVQCVNCSGIEDEYHFIF